MKKYNLILKLCIVLLVTFLFFQLIMLIDIVESSDSINVEFGITYNESIKSLAEMGSYVFSAVAGDVVLVNMRVFNFSGYVYPRVEVFAPNGSRVMYGHTSVSNGVSVRELLPVSGEYTVLASSTGVCEYSIFFQRLNNPGAFTTVNFGETRESSIKSLAEMGSYVFSAVAGDVVLVNMHLVNASGYMEPGVEILAPNGSRIVYGETSVSREISVRESLPVNGKYTVLASSTGISEYSIFFQKLGSEGEGVDTQEEIKENITIFEDISVIEIVTISTAVVGTSALVIIAGTSLGKYKFLSFLSLLGPLYLRTVKDDVFDNQKRLTMYTHIAEHQPVVYSEIKKTCNLSDGEVYWHAHIMTQLDMIRMERKGFHLFFYLSGRPRLSPEEFIRLTDIQQSLLDRIKEKPGITQAELVGILGLKQQNISYNLLKLEEKGKIRTKIDGKVKYYYPSEEK